MERMRHLRSPRPALPSRLRSESRSWLRLLLCSRSSPLPPPPLCRSRLPDRSSRCGRTSSRWPLPPGRQALGPCVGRT